MAKLYFYYGAMGSTKTVAALTTVYNYKERGQNPLLMKTSTDTRDGKYIIRSRIGLEAECKLLEDIMTMQEDELKKYDVIVVDEIQFAKVDEINRLADIVDIYNIPVLCYGLRTDFQLNFFEGSGRLMALADEIKEIKTMCWCGKKATCNARYDENGIIYSGEQVVLGSNHNYIPLCRKHYKMGLMRDPHKTDNVWVVVHKDALNHQYNGDENLVEILIPSTWMKNYYESSNWMSDVYHTYDEFLEHQCAEDLDEMVEAALKDDVILDQRDY